VRACCSAIDRLRHLTSFPVQWDGKSITTHAWCGVVEGLPVYLLEAEQPVAFFWRGQFYGEVGGLPLFQAPKCFVGKVLHLLMAAQRVMCIFCPGRGYIGVWPGLFVV
jgi:hypothetical protein